MNQQLYVLLYSKYSQNSNNIIKFIQSAPVDLVTSIGLNPICIDNEKIRDRIMNCKEVHVQSVPTVLIVYPTGGVEKYEGITAFNWVEDMVNKLIPPKPQPPPLPVQNPEPIIMSEESDNEPEQELPLQTNKVKIPKPKPNTPNNPGKELNANIIDLDTLDNEEEEVKNTTVAQSVKSGSNLMAQAMAMQKERESS